MKTDILGVAFDALTLDDADALLRSGAGGYIVTANPEIVLHCREDAAYAAAVNGAALVLADGVGDLCAARILGTPLPERVTGADLVPRLLSRLAQRSGSVFLYGARPGVAQRAGEKLKNAYPGLRIAGAENGYISDETALFAALEQKKPDLLLLGLGAPRQELWMARNRQKINAVMIGVGGLLDVFAGDIPRAPESWQRLGLEWLYRLLREPKRLKRMIRLPKILLLAAVSQNKSAAAAAAVVVSAAAAVAAAAAPAAAEQDENDDDPETAVIISTEHGEYPFPVPYLRPGRARRSGRSVTSFCSSAGAFRPVCGILCPCAAGGYNSKESIYV